MNQNIITYLNENKEKYSKDALVAELKKAGYAEGDIAEGIVQAFGLPAPMKTSFWNFKDKKVYTKASEKWADFLFGFFAPSILWFIPDRMEVFLVVILIGIFIARYLAEHRCYMFGGLLTSFVLLIIWSWF